MRQFVLSIFITFFSLQLFSEVIPKDKIILRNGDERQVDIYEISLSSIGYYALGPDGSVIYVEIPLEDIYMITKAKLGDIFISPNGSLIFGREMSESKGADCIYFTEGIKLIAKISAITLDKVSFGFNYKDYKAALEATESSKDLHALLVQAGPDGTVTVDKDKVFMIKQNGGMRLVLTPLSPVVREQEKSESSKENQDDTDPNNDDIPEDAEQVIFHMVEAGQTLDVIARRYGVTPQDIIEWNDLPKRTRKNQVLNEDSQLIIYVKPIDSRK